MCPFVQDCLIDNDMMLVGRMLLENAESPVGYKQKLTQRDIAEIAGMDWYKVHNSLKSLQIKGAIKIERNRLIIHREALQKEIG